MAKDKTFEGSLARDSNNNYVPFGAAFRTSDVSGTPKTSPLAYSTAVLTITVPTDAVEFVVRPSTALRVSDVANAATYVVVPTATQQTFSCTRTSYIYLVRDSEDGSAQFHFTLV